MAWKGPTPFYTERFGWIYIKFHGCNPFLAGEPTSNKSSIGGKGTAKALCKNIQTFFQNYELWLEIVKKIILLIIRVIIIIVIEYVYVFCMFILYPLGNDHISDQTGSWENNLLKNAGWDRGICDRSQEGICFHCITPWKINGWNIQITHEKKGKWSEPNLYEDMFQPLIFQGLPSCCFFPSAFFSFHWDSGFLRSKVPGEAEEMSLFAPWEG